MDIKIIGMLSGAADNIWQVLTCGGNDGMIKLWKLEMDSNFKKASLTLIEGKKCHDGTLKIF